MKKSNRPLLLLSLGILFISCMIVIVVYLLLVDMIQRAEHEFGPASDRLGTLQKLQYAQRLLNDREALEKPLAQPGEQITFMIEPGETINSITNRLQDAGWIQSASTLRDYLVFSGLDTSLQSGEFDLDASMNAVQIAQKLQDSTPDKVTFNILAGWRIEEIAATIPTSGLEFLPDDFIAAAANPTQALPLKEYLPADASLEGFLFPDRYRLPRETTQEQLIEILTSNFGSKVDHQMRVNYNNLGLSLFEAVTLASIVQREAVIQEEMPMIASVFLNRLEIGMKLETDPTVQYALGYDLNTKSWWKNPLSLDDLEVHSAYNTYKFSGLPPGPISNPGFNALMAVAYPAQTPYFFFRSACDNSGFHNFAENFEQHKQNACQDGIN